MEAAGWQWSGHGYFDANFGTRALEEDFSRWTWGRYPARGGALATYDAVRRDGTELATAARFDATGGAEDRRAAAAAEAVADALGHSAARRAGTRARGPGR